MLLNRVGFPNKEFSFQAVKSSNGKFWVIAFQANTTDSCKFTNKFVKKYIGLSFIFGTNAIATFLDDCQCAIQGDVQIVLPRGDRGVGAARTNYDF